MYPPDADKRGSESQITGLIRLPRRLQTRTTFLPSIIHQFRETHTHTLLALVSTSSPEHVFLVSKSSCRAQQKKLISQSIGWSDSSRNLSRSLRLRPNATTPSTVTSGTEIAIDDFNERQRKREREKRIFEARSRADVAAGARESAA